MSKRKPKRIVFYVQAGFFCWLVECSEHPGEPLIFKKKMDAMKAARAAAKTLWTEKGRPAQVYGRRKNGRFLEEASYGCNSKARG